MKEPAKASVVLEAIRSRRAVRSYLPETVREADIRALLEAAVQAPTAMHLEPWAFVIVQDRALLARISSRAKELTLATSDQGASAEAPAGRFAAMLADPGFNIFYDAGTLIVICAPAERGRFAEADCWLAAENLMLAAHALGLGTCCIGFALPALRASDVKREIGMPDAVEPVAAIIVGVPRGETPPVPRKPPLVLAWIG
jgi:nitroreductase